MYYYIFYRLYKMAQKTEKQWSPNMRTPVAVAFFSIAILQFINLLTLFVILKHGIQLDISIELSKEKVILVGIVILLINYYIFIRNKNFSNIETRFDEDSSKSKNLKKMLFWIYIVLTFVLFFTVLETFKTVNR